MTIVGKPSQQGRVDHGSANHDAHSCSLCEQIEAGLAPRKGAVTAPTRTRSVAVPAPPGAPRTPTSRPVPEVAVPEVAVLNVPVPPVPVRAAPPVPVRAAPPVPVPPVAARPVPVPPVKAPVELAPAVPVSAEPVPVDPASSDSVQAPAEPRRIARTVVVICAVAAIVAAGVVAFALLHSSGHAKSAGRSATGSAPAGSVAAAPTGSSPSAPSPTVASAIEWARAQVASDVPLVADGSTSSALSAAGFTQVAHVTPTSSVATFVYLFDTPAVRAAAAQNPSVANALTSSVAVAEFGSGTDLVDVRQAVSDSAAVVNARRASDTTTRRTAEQELLRNPAVTATGNAATALAQGQLDLRAATVLAYLANSTTVRVTNVSVSDPEQAADLPVRSVDIAIGAPAVMQTIVSGLPVAYQPTSVTQLSSGAVRMVWPIAGEPLPELS